MPVTVSPTASDPTHDLSLNDGSTTIGFKLVNSRGEHDPTQLRRVSLVRTPLKQSSGSTKYADLEPPYTTIAQDDWSGGRGIEHHEDDASRFFDSFRVDTLKDGIILGGQESYGTGYRDSEVSAPGSVTWQGLHGSQRHLSRSFTASATYNARNLEIWVRKVGTPNNGLTISIYSNSAGDPNASMNDSIIVSGDITETYLSLHAKHDLGITSLTSGTTYHVVVGEVGANAPDASNHYEVAIDTTVNGKQSTDRTTWSTASNKGLYFRVTDVDVDRKFLFFTYKQALYAVTQPDSGGNSTCYINGDRGAADSNSADKSLLNDATKSWTADEWIGAYAVITAGPGSNENQPWRQITDNDATSLTVSPDWNITHTTSTEYVIVGSNKWTSKLAIGAFCTDVAVADEFVYFARGDDHSGSKILRFREYNNGGTWTEQNAADLLWADKLLAIRHPNDEHVLYLSDNQHPFYGVTVLKGRVPKRWGDLYNDLGIMAATDTPWDAWSVSNVTQTASNGATQIAIAAGFTTGVAAVENLSAPVDITQANSLGLLVYSSIAQSSGDTQILLDDQLNLGQSYEVGVLKFNTTDMANAHDGDTSTSHNPTWTTSDYVYVGHASVKFNQIHVDVATGNTATSTLSAQIWNGYAWTSISITDGTASGGATMNQDGDITFTPIHDWEKHTYDGVSAYYVRLKVSANLDGATSMNEIYVTRKSNTTLNLPTLNAAEWTWTELDITPTGYPIPDHSAIQSIGLNVATDNGAQTVKIFGGIRLIQNDLEYIPLPNDSRITGLEAYSGGTDEVRENAWIITESAIYEIQSQNDDAPVALPLREIASVRNFLNGRSHTVSDVYLYWNLSQKLERYFNRNLDDIGPDLDAGLPEDRQGDISALLAYPGRLYLAIDGGTTDYSSILMLSGKAWHEVHRGFAVDESIRGMAIQALPTGITQRLWINQGSDLIWVPVSLNPYRDANYRFTYEGTLESPWIHAGMQDVRKIWNSLKIFGENLTANRYVQADYMIDSDSSWTAISGNFDTVPVEEISISSASPPNVNGRRLKYRLRIYTNSNSETPRIRAVVVEAVAFIPDKSGWNIQFSLNDYDLAVDIQGEGESSANTLATVFSQLQTWRNNGTQLTMRTNSAINDSLTVFIDSPAAQLRTLDLQGVSGIDKERHIGQISLSQV